MLTTKKISPIEFRLHNKAFLIDFSPENYFEKFRFEIIFQRILFWFYLHYGIYFYIQKLKILDTDKILFQFYYYKTYLFKRYLRNRIRSKVLSITYSKGGFEEGIVFPELTIDSFTYLIENFPRIKRNMYRNYRFYYYDRKFRLKLRRKSVVFINLFFTYFWNYYFQRQIITLHKSLFKISLSNKAIRAEYKILLGQTRYIHRKKWALDFLFFFHHFITFMNSNFLFPFFVHHIKHTVRQKPIIRLFINVLRLMYFYRGLIKGARLLIHGTIDRHGRTKTLVYDLGVISLATDDSVIFYDIIQCPTKYGIINIKLWICYFVPIHDKLVSKVKKTLLLEKVK